METAGNLGRQQRPKGFFLGEAIKVVSLTVLVAITSLSLLRTMDQHNSPNNKLPSPSLVVESMSMTVVGVASDTEVYANLEVDMAVVLENNTKYYVDNDDEEDPTTFRYYTPLILGFYRGSKFGRVPLWNLTSVPNYVRQRAGETSKVLFAIKKAAVKVDEYEHNIYTRNGASYFELDLSGIIETTTPRGDDGVERSAIYFRADCGQPVKVVFPLFPWHQTQKLDFGSSKTCQIFFVKKLDY